MKPSLPSLMRIAALASLLLPNFSRAAPGDLDTSFHGTGWTSLTLPGVEPYAFPTYGRVREIALQTDSKIVIRGRTNGGGYSPFYRLLPGGSLDASFNGTGFVLHPPFFATDFDPAMALQDDGKTVLAVSHWSVNMVSVLRFLPDGSPDTAFGNGGGFVSTPLIESAGYPGQVVLQKDGKIVVAFGTGIWRYHTNGSLDLSFGNAGRATALGGVLAVQPDGKILVGGFGGNTLDVLRLNPDWSPDPSFGTAGRASLPINGGTVSVSVLVVMKDGRILAGGRGSPNSGIGRFLSNGIPDLSFNGTGWVATDIGDIAYKGTILVQNDGRLIVGGGSGFARFNSNGTLDSGFGSGGKVVSSVGTIYGMALLPDGKLLTAGMRTEEDAFLAHYETGINPGLLVEEPAGNPLLNAGPAPLDFGPVTGTSLTKLFTIRNTSPVPLTDISVSLSAQSHPGEYLLTPPPVTTLAPGAETILLIMFAPSASASPGPSTATLTITSSDTNNSPFLIPLSGTRATPSQAWRLTNFNFAGNTGPGADLNDFDHDGLINLLEYATLANPRQPSPAPGTLVKNGSVLEFSYTRPTAALTELTYQTQTAATPSGPWSPDNITTTILTDDGTTQTVKSTTPATAARQFLRLRITRP